MNKIYLKIITNKKYLNFVFLVLYIVWFFFYKNFKIVINSFYSYNNSFWDLVLILNNNNKSILFFVLILFSILFINKIEKRINTNFLFIFLIFVYISKFVFAKINFFTKNYNFININLTNGLIIIHPVCIYLTYVFIILFIFLNTLVFKKINKIIILITKINKISLNFIYLALFLGSYWSQQEMNWGGWWNWDFVEIIAFVFFLMCSLIIHVKLIKNLNFIKKIIKNFIKFFIIFFFIVRIDIINSIHTFNAFSKNNFSFNLMLYIYIIFIIIVNNINNYNKYYINTINIKNKNILIFLFLILIVLFNIYIYINMLTSYFFEIQYTELTKFLKKFINYIILAYLIYLANYNKKLTNFLFLFIYYINIYLFYLIINIIIIKIINNYKYNYKNLFHIFIIIFIIINNFYYNYIYYLINLYLIKSNINLLNNINTLDNSKNYLMYLYYYNNNNYLITNNNYLLLNNYYCYNNNILFNNVFKETLLNNILLYNNYININYSIDNFNIIFNYFIIYKYLFYTILIIFPAKKLLKLYRINIL